MTETDAASTDAVLDVVWTWAKAHDYTDFISSLDRRLRRALPVFAAHALRDAAAELDEAGQRYAAQVLRRFADEKGRADATE